MKLLRNIRIIILIVVLVLAIAAINPRPWQDGVTIRNVDKDSAAAAAGIVPSSPGVSPVLRERIVSMNDVPIEDETAYNEYVSTLPPNVTVRVQTNKDIYLLTTVPAVETTTLDELETVTITEETFNQTSESFENVSRTVTRNRTIETIVGTEPLGFNIYDAPKTNIRFGLDISGGARVMLQPERDVSQEEMTMVLDTIKQRMNTFGLSDIVVRQVGDLAGNQFVLVEIAGASESDVRELILRQGKFEAKIGEETVFSGGNDITYVCRSPDCSGLSPRGCQPVSEGYVCEFNFEITLTPDAAERQASVTRNLGVVPGAGGQYLEKPLDLYLDDQLVDSLQISSTLRGSAVTSISISGSGAGATLEQAQSDAVASMKNLQTILITGSLPVKLNVVKTDAISAELGDEFIRNALFAGLLALIAITVIIVTRYRSLKIAVPVMVTLLSELTIILGVAALIGWNMDLAAIAGILIAIGTGVDDQIIIADETIGGRKREERGSWKEKLGKAFFIIFASYATALAAMIPLWWAGAGLVRGFAITTIIGISIGVFITRPAFAIIMEKLEGGEE